MLAVALATIILTVAVLAVTRFDTFGENTVTLRAVPTQVTSLSSGGGWGMLPIAAQLSISRALGNDIHAYWARAAAGGFVTSGPHGAPRATYSRAGVDVKVRGGTAGLSLSAYGEGSQLGAVAPVNPTASRASVAYQRGPLRESYANGPYGVEQSLDLATAPPAGAGGKLTFSFALSGSLSARINGLSVDFVAANGRVALRERDLGVYDAGGKLLPATLSISDRHLLLHVNAAGARYPIHVDPTLTTTTNNVPSKVAAAGNTVVVGDVAAGPDPNALGPGEAWVFVEPAAGWQNATQTATLTAPATPAFTQYGGSVGVTMSPGGLATVAVTDQIQTTNPQTQTLTTAGNVLVYVEPTTGWPATVSPTADLSNPNTSFGRIAMSATTSGQSTIAAYVPETFSPTTVPAQVDVFVQPSTGWASTSTPNAQLSPRRPETRSTPTARSRSPPTPDRASAPSPWVSTTRPSATSRSSCSASRRAAGPRHRLQPQR